MNFLICVTYYYNTSLIEKVVSVDADLLYATNGDIVP